MNDNVGQRAFQNARLKKRQKAETTKLFERAVALVETGALGDARAILRQLLQLTPNHFDALYLLGMSEYHARSYHEAERILALAVDAEPRSAEAHFNRGVVLNLLQRFDEARASYLRAVALKPHYPPALYNLGYVCGLLRRLDEAIGYYDRALAAKTDYAEAWYNRGLLLEQLRRYQEAVESHDRALAIKPRYAEALSGRGNALNALGRSAEALMSHDEALAINPNHAQALNNRGVALSALKRDADALDSYDKAIAANPKFADAYNNRGNVQRALGFHADSLDSYDKALAINPGFMEALNGRGAALTHLRDYEQALACFARVIERKPDYAEAFSNRGGTWLELKQQAEAIANFDRALALNPQLTEAWLLRGHALLASKRTAEAIACAEKVIALAPDTAVAHALLGMCLAALGDVEGAITKYDTALAIKPGCVDAILAKIFALDFSGDADFEQHRDVRLLWWEHIGSHIPVKHQPHRNNRDPHRRLRLGYVSSDFRGHSAAWVFKPVLKYTDKAQFETLCYSCSPIRDTVTGEFEEIADRWHDASRWNDDRLAEQIRQDEIDILIDLSGHTAGNRLSVVATKPAPVVVHGWGHGTPPGLPAIDYVFSDPVSIPAEVRHLFKEKLYDLPCTTTLEPLPVGVPVVVDLPAARNRFVTFGVFNRVSKISDSAIEAWSRILGRLPSARLTIKDAQLDDAFIRENLLTRFARHGVEAGRLDLLGATTREDHLSAMGNVDITLDTFPQTGGVSTWESLQLGIPVVTRLGGNLSSRASGGILSAVGLSNWVADSAQAYIEIAVTRASRTEELAGLRRVLPEQIATSAAGNPKAYATEVGKAYRRMWQEYCAREPDQNPN